MNQLITDVNKGICSNTYCTRGTNGKRAPVAVRDTRTPAYCSQSCAQMMQRYKNRYKGSLHGRATQEYIVDKMKNI